MKNDQEEIGIGYGGFFTGVTGQISVTVDGVKKKKNLTFKHATMCNLTKLINFWGTFSHTFNQVNSTPYHFTVTVKKKLGNDSVSTLHVNHTED